MEAHDASSSSANPTIVFVHGAWADNSGFDGSIRAVRARGLPAIGVANPLRDLRSDAAYVAATLRSIDGPIVLVGHSYGGAVISNAAVGVDNVRALAYINGWVPDEGESLLQLVGLNEGSLVGDSLRPISYTAADGTEVVDLYIDQDRFHEVFAGDVDPETARAMAVAQRPFTEAAFGAASGPVAWKTIPSWYQLGTGDNAIPPATQRYMAERAGSRIVEVPASHASMVSQPEATTDLIMAAAARAGVAAA